MSSENQRKKYLFMYTVTGYITKRRIEKAIELLKNSELSIDAIANEVGFSEASYFYKVFKKETGKTPGFYR